MVFQNPHLVPTFPGLSSVDLSEEQAASFLATQGFFLWPGPKAVTQDNSQAGHGFCLKADSLPWGQEGRRQPSQVRSCSSPPTGLTQIRLRKHKPHCF